MRSLDGISHVSLSVTDMHRARWFWTTVMGFEVGIEVPGATVCVPVSYTHLTLPTN